MKKQTRPTLRDVAKQAGVSVSSVSNYLNGYPYMRKGIKEQIAIAIDELGYVANVTARNLKSGRTGLLSLSIPDLNQIYFAELAEEVIKAGREYGFRVIVESTGNDKERELASIQSMKDGRSDGLILSPVKMTDLDLAAFKGDYPIVLLGERIFQADMPHVVIKNTEAAECATELLIQAGCKRIAIVGGSTQNVPSSRLLRTQGYINALKKHGYPIDTSLIRETNEWTSFEASYAVQQMFSEGNVPDGIFAANDLLALGVLNKLKELNVKVPNDVKVIGFDNITESTYMFPSLTTIDPGRDRIARTAVQLVNEQIESGRRGSRHQILVDFNVVYRESLPLGDIESAAIAYRQE